MRRALDFGPLQWCQQKGENLESLEDLYQELMNGRFACEMLLETNIQSAVAFFDQRYPLIRTMSRRVFENIRYGRVVDHELIHLMINQENLALQKIFGAFECERKKWIGI
uniref:ImmA/IrrE family metallo-endopeptidase n=1 Tax=Caenorhabditis tropicalis TaxID=1561998 RepID=A0A1I7UQY4_9PELO